MNNIGGVIYRWLQRAHDKSFGNIGNFIVDSSTALAGGVYNTGIVLEDVTDFTCTDTKLISGSAVHPTTLSAGTVLYGNFTTATVGAGVIKFYSK